MALLTWFILALAVAGCAENQQTGDTELRVTAGGSNGNNGREQEATLELQGEPDTEFTGSCTVGDQEPDDVGGRIPGSFTYELEGEPLDCEIRADDDLQVNLTVGETVRSVQRINGGTLHLSYDNGSISSSVSSSGPGGGGSSSSSQSEATSESRNVSGFDEVELQGIGNLTLRQTGTESLSVEAEEDVLPKIRTEVENDRLILGPEPGASISTDEPINYTLTVDDLSALEVSGSGDVEAEGIDTDKLEVSISGTADVEVSGRADRQDIEISGSGSYVARDLESREAKIEVGGAGSAIVNVSDELDAEVSGSGSVQYLGEPTVDQDVSEAGEVKKRQ